MMAATDADGMDQIKQVQARLNNTDMSCTQAITGAYLLTCAAAAVMGAATLLRQRAPARDQRAGQAWRAVEDQGKEKQL